jgi:hypothetical protein
MKYAAFFLTIACLGFWISLSGNLPIVVRAGALWGTASAVALAFAYLRNQPSLLFKSATGVLTWRSWLIFGPWIVLCIATERVARQFDRANPIDNAGSLRIGRKPTPNEAAALRSALVLDLTAEFSEVLPIRSGQYRYFPILDASTPSLESLLSLLSDLPDQASIFVHCAQGRGRTGLVAASILLKRREASNPQDAVNILTTARPVIRLNRRQRAMLERVGAHLAQAGGEQSIGAEGHGRRFATTMTTGSAAAP